MARLKDIYNNTVKPQLLDKFKYKSVMEVPNLEKIVINMGVGEAVQNPKALKRC